MAPRRTTTASVKKAPASTSAQPGGGSEKNTSGIRKRADGGAAAASMVPERPPATKKAKRAPERKKSGEDVAVVQASAADIAKGAMIIQVLDRLYPDPPCPLDYKDHFTLLCAVLLSAQTTDGRVNEVTKELFRVAPDPAALSAMDQADVLRIIQSVGLAPTKAKNLLGMATQLVERFGGRVPNTYEELESLPGVGHKTASVVMCEAFGEASFPVDTHIHRLALRWGLSKADKNVARVEADLKAVFPQSTWATAHLQMIYFGREHCQAKAHSPSACPVCAWVGRSELPLSLADIPQLGNASPKKASKSIVLYGERRAKLSTPGSTVRSITVELAAAVSGSAEGSGGAAADTGAAVAAAAAVMVSKGKGKGKKAVKGSAAVAMASTA